MTPAGTRPGDKPAPAKRRRQARPPATGASPPRRATRRPPPGAKESPPWLPALMLGLFVLGGIAIMARYLVFPDSNWPMLVGLACLLGGLFLATSWR